MKLTVNGKAPDLKIANLADLKRTLAVPGTIVKLVAMDDKTRSIREKRPERLAVAEAGRKVAKLQINAWMMDDNAWMNFGQAAEWTFPGDDTATWHGGPDQWLTYRLLVPADVMIDNRHPAWRDTP